VLSFILILFSYLQIMINYYLRLTVVLVICYGCMYILFGGCQTINYILMIPIYLFFNWIFDDPDAHSSFLSTTMLFTFLVAGTLSYVWHNSTLARSLGVACHILGPIMDTSMDEVQEEIDRIMNEWQRQLD
jgi:hypothetical protein